MSSEATERRNFLKLTSIVGATTLTMTSLLWGSEHINGIEEFLSKLELAIDRKEGKFNYETKKITTLDSLKSEIMTDTSKLDGVEESHIYICDNNHRSEIINYNSRSDIYMPASTSKIIICNEAWKMGQHDGCEYLTPELAHQILKQSWNYVDLVMKLPIARGKCPEDLEQITRQILTNAGVPPQNNIGELPLKVRMSDQFEYLYNMSLPRLMADAMLQTDSDSGKNYGVSDVLMSNLQNKLPAYFKMGLIYNSVGMESKLVGTYYFQVGDDIKTLGYATGSNICDIHKQMLCVGANVANYAINRNV